MFKKFGVKWKGSREVFWKEFRVRGMNILFIWPKGTNPRAHENIKYLQIYLKLWNLDTDSKIWQEN